MSAETAPRAAGTAPDRVELSVPADPAYLGVLRTACAGLAARMDLMLDEIEDLRIAVDEAGTLLLTGAGGTDRLRAVFVLDDDALEIEVHGPAPTVPAPGSVAWALLEALVGHVDAGPHEAEPGSLIRLRHLRSARP